MVRGEMHTWFQPQELQIAYVTTLKDCDFPRAPAHSPGGLLHSTELLGSYFCNKLCLHRFICILQLFIVLFGYFNVILKAFYSL